MWYLFIILALSGQFKKTKYLKILEKQGEFKDFGKCTYLGQIKDNKKYGGVIIVVKYEEGNVNYSLAYDEDMNLVSFTM